MEADISIRDEKQNKEWDEHCAAAPECIYCGRSVYPYPTYVQIGDRIYCERCIFKGTFSTEELEL